MISADDVQRAEDLGMVVIVPCKDPAAVRVLEPGLTADVSAQARAALQLSRWVLHTGQNTSTFVKGDLVKTFVDLLIAGERAQPVERVKR